MDTAVVAGAPIPSYEELCCKSKAYRAMTYLPYTQPQPQSQPQLTKLQIPRARSKKGAPLDPDDLSRRLRAYIAQEKALTEQRRTSRAPTTTGIYHHIPQVAALSFSNTTTTTTTTTQEKPRHIHIHRFSAPAPQNLGSRTADQALDRGAERSPGRKRNPYPWTAEWDGERDGHGWRRRTLSSDAPEVHKSRAVQRPMSMGDLLAWEEKGAPAPREMKRDRNDRHDWTQRDESEEVRRSMRERVGPLLSLRLGKGKGKGKASDGAGEEIGLQSPVKSSSRASFFGRFKRSFSNNT
ncbi:hypothetical protein MFRU_045g00290 [Monilinia fructicola]|nr:hypothetical protein MFRU_045g00290 [Monilinia fructicola]